jgi:hypothetical protein
MAETSSRPTANSTGGVLARATIVAYPRSGGARETPVVADGIRLRIDARRLPTTTALHGQR